MSPVEQRQERYYQKVAKPVNLEERLTEFTNGLGFESKHLDNLKDLIGSDAISAVDLMNKVILYGKHSNLHHVAKETAYVAYSMLGRKNKIVTDLKRNIESIPDYDKIYQQYKDKSPNLPDGKIKELITIDFLADSIRNNWEAPKDSYTNRKSEFWSKADFPPATKKTIGSILRQIWESLKSLFVKSDKNRVHVGELADDLANDILSKNYQKFQTELAPDQQRVNYEETIAKDPVAKKIVERFHDMGLTLTGSLSVRKQGTLYRTPDENLHDLDFTVQNHLVNKELQEDIRKAKYLAYDYGQNLVSKVFHKQIIENIDNYSFFKNIKKNFPEFEITKSFVDKDNRICIAGKIGEHGIDLFIKPKEHDRLDKDEQGYQDWKQVFLEKLRLGRAKDMLDFVHYKPFNIDENGKFAQIPSFRHFTFEKESPVKQAPISFQKTSTKEKPIPELDKVVEKFLSKANVDVQRLKDEGQDFAAMYEPFKKTVSVVDGKADITTLGEEATHVYVRMLDKDSKLYRDIIKDVRNRDEFDEVYEQYKDDPQYQKDGEPDEEKIAEEAAGKIAAKVIAGKFKDQKAMKWWERLWNYIKSLFKDKKWEDTIAEDILGAKTTRLSKEKIRKMEEAAERGEIYYQKLDHVSDDAKKYIEDLLSSKHTSDVQKALVKAFYLKDEGYEKVAEHLGVKPHIPAMLIKKENGLPVHKHMDVQGREYPGITTLIKGKLSETQQADLQWIADIGTDVHSILEGLAIDKKVEEIETSHIPDDIKRTAYKILGAFIEDYKAKGYIALPEVEAIDPVSGVATAIDLLLLSRDGTDNKIVDLKNSLTAALIKDAKTGKDRKSDKYLSSWEMEEGSVFKAAGIELSKDLQHAIQLGCCGKLMELQGVPVTGLYILHMLLKTEKGISGITGIQKEGVSYYSPTDNEPYVNLVIPTEIDEQNPSQLQMNRPGYDYSDIDPQNPSNEPKSDEQVEKEAEGAEQLDTLKPVVDKAIDLLNQRQVWLQDLNRSKPGAEIKNKTIDTLTQFRRSLITSRDAGDYNSAMKDFMEYTRKQVETTMDFIRDTNNYTLKEERYPQILIQASKFLDGYQGVYKLVDRETGAKHKEYAQVVGSLNELQEAIREGLQGYFATQFRKNFPPEVIPDSTITEWIYGMSPDITQATYNLEAPHGTRDLGISAMDKELRDALFFGNQISVETVKKVQDMQQKLFTALGTKKYQKGMYDFMTNKDGTLTQRVGKQYWDMVKSARDLILDDNGNELEEKEGNSPEVIAYNKDLHNKKEAYRNLTRAEVYDKVSQDYVEGQYQRYTQEFKDARSQHEYQNKYGIWEPRHPESAAYREYREKHYIVIPDVYEKIYDKKGEFTGVVGDRTNIWVVNPHFKEVKDKRTDGLELRDEKYLKMLNDQSSVGKARKEFYDSWMKLADSYYGELPLSVIKNMKGKMPVKEATWLEQCKQAEGLNGLLGVIGKSVKDQFTYGTYYGERMVDEAGNFKQSIPVGYTGDFRDQERIQDLNKQIADLESRKTTGEFKQKHQQDYYRQQRDILKASLQAEMRKITPDKVEQDIAKGLMDFIPQAEKYIQKDRIEDKVLALRALIQLKTETGGYFERDTLNRTIYKKGTTEPLALQETYAEKMAKHICEVIMYNSGERDNSFMKMMAENMARYTGILAFAGQPLTSLSVGSMGMFNIARSAVGGQHFGMRSLASALGEYWKEMVPAWTKGKLSGNKTPYHSKGEALVALYQVPVKMFAPDKGFWHLATMNEHATEYFIQAVPAIATMKSKNIKGADSSTKKLWDCWNFDKTTGKLTPVKGFEHVAGDKEMTKWFGYLQDVNNMEHGPFAAMEQNVVSKHWLGKLGMMFHKVIWPGFKSRFANSYTHQNFGEIEGSYRTTLNFVADMKHFEGSIKDKMEQNWEGLSDNQRSNIRKTLFDLGVFMFGFALIAVIKSIEQGIPEDDKNLRKWINFLHRMSERVLQSQIMYIPIIGSKYQYQMLKSPIASLGTMANFGDALMETMQLPFPPYGDHYYTNGIHKGELKAYEKTLKVLPIISLRNHWESLTSDQYFK